MDKDGQENELRTVEKKLRMCDKFTETSVKRREKRIIERKEWVRKGGTRSERPWTRLGS
jgi:hypothetical protein